MCARIALALALLAVASSTATADCLSEYGAGCTNCVNVTLTGGRRLMQSGPTVAAQHARGGGPGGRGGPGGGGRPGRGSRSALTCTACGTPGYVLLTETRGAVTLGRCGCAPGWCVQLPDPATLTTPAPRPRIHGHICVNCSLTDQVPLTNVSGVILTYANGTWSLVLGSPSDGAAPNFPWFDSRGRHSRNSPDGRPMTPPPYHRGQCITCPEGSAPSADFVSCVATPPAENTAVMTVDEPQADDLAAAPVDTGRRRS